MTTPQPGVFALGSRYHQILELDLRPGVDDAAVRAALPAMRERDVTAGGTNVVVAFGPDLWSRLTPGVAPAGLAAFQPIEGIDQHRAAATQRDIWVWVHGSGSDAVLDTAVAVRESLDPVATLGDETVSFVYHDSRDLTGFVDGTANPVPSDAPTVALVPPGEPGEGGSHVLTQRWVHDLEAFAKLDVADQERVIGRTKLDSVELPADQRPADSHISVAEIHDSEGNERPIFRRSTPFGTLAERGLYFLGFSAERERFEEMLHAMYGLREPTPRDRILDFSEARTGAYWFAPSIEELAAVSG
jgi:putative iron-dependent peroxidase